MKRVVAISLLFVFSFTALVQSYLVVHYCWNYRQYATELCENQDKPALNCNGKCQLNKELKASKGQGTETPIGLPAEVLPTFLSPFIANSEGVVFSVFRNERRVAFPEIASQPCNGFFKIPLPPPKVAC